VPTLNGAKTLRVPPGPSTARSQRLRGEGPPTPGVGTSGQGRYPLSLYDRCAEGAERGTGEAVEALAKTLDGDPRAGLFESAGASAKAGNDDAEGS